jgi:hypothetical protein
MECIHVSLDVEHWRAVEEDSEMCGCVKCSELRGKEGTGSCWRNCELREVRESEGVAAWRLLSSC